MKLEANDPTAEPVGDSVRELRQQVQHNCSISDAIYAREYTLCIYLLRMREFYRWKNHIPLGRPLTLDDVGDWVSLTEEHWDEIEEQPFLPLRIGDTECDPFDSVAINSLLMRHASEYRAPLIYSAGFGRRGQPHFLLAEGERKTLADGTILHLCTQELARDINAPPAMTRASHIVISRAGLRRMLWEFYEEWSFNRNDGPMERLSRRYGWVKSFERGVGLDRAEEDLIDVLIAHEVGEVKATAWLPERWSTMMETVVSTNSSTPTALSISNELYMRVVRDNLADSLQTWPTIAERGQSACLDFWLASLGTIRKKMLKDSGFEPVLSARSDSERLTALSAVTAGQAHYWQTLARTMVDLFEREGENGDLASIIAA